MSPKHYWRLTLKDGSVELSPLQTVDEHEKMLDSRGDALESNHWCEILQGGMSGCSGRALPIADAMGIAIPPNGWIISRR